jgi:hypothetical protein
MTVELLTTRTVVEHLSRRLSKMINVIEVAEPTTPGLLNGLSDPRRGSCLEHRRAEDRADSRRNRRL